MKKLVYIILCLQVFILSALGEGRMELPAKRTFNSKTFLNQDGTYTTEISSGYLHYMDTDSTYAEIDHNFRKTHRSGYDYEVTRGLYRVYAKSDVSDSASLVVETSDGLSLAMGLWGVAYLDVSSKDYKVLQRTRSTSGVVEGNRLSFPAAFKGVEVRYSYLDTRLKEEILISQAARERLPDPAQYGFARKNTYLVFITELETDRDRIRSYVSAGFDSTGEDYETEGRIDFKTLRGELKFFFPVDRAYLESGEENMDSAFETAVRKRLISRNNKRYLLAGVPLSWLKGLPAGTVIIDPTVSLYPTHDAYLRSGTPGSNYGSSSEVQVGNGSPGRLRSLFKFDLSAIPSTARLVSSEFKLYYFSWLGNYPPTLRVLTCHQMLKDWNESSVSWSYQNLGGSIPWNTPGVGRDNVDAKSTAEYGVGVYATYGWISFNLKNLTGRWLNGDPNYGILLVDLYENTYGDYKRFRSSEASSNKPVLSVTYQLLKNFFYIKDHLGNIRVTLDEQGSVVGYDDYYPFGMQMDGRSYNQGLEDNIYKYSSKELDEEQLTGGKLDWYYFGARYYDPDIGRWLRVDPMADKFPNLSPYTYPYNNPIRYTDPTGMAGDDTNEDEEEKNDLLSVIVNTFKNYIESDTKFSEEQAQEIEADKSKIQKNIEQSTNEVLELMETSQPYITLSVGKQTMGTGVQGSVILTGDGVALSGGVDATAGYGIPVGISFGLVRRTDGQPASVSDLSNIGIGSTFGAGIGFEFVASPDATVYNKGFVISPAIWGGGNIGYSFTKTFKFKNK